MEIILKYTKNVFTEYLLSILSINIYIYICYASRFIESGSIIDRIP